MKRFLATMARALSLALFLLSVVFWVRSNFRWDSSMWAFGSATERKGVEFSSDCNVFHLMWGRTRLDPPSAATSLDLRVVFGGTGHRPWISGPIRPRVPFRWRSLGFSGSARRSTLSFELLGASLHSMGVTVTIPYWSLALVTGVLPGLRLRRWLRSRKRPAGTGAFENGGSKTGTYLV